MQKLKRKLSRTLLGKDPDYPDMFTSVREQFFAQLYLRKIRAHLSEVFGERKISLLDAGCQAGRLSIPLARDGHEVTGVDTSSFALKRAALHAKETGVSLSLLHGDVSKILEKENCLFDAILCLEVLYLRENFKDFLRIFREHLTENGFLAVSHRTKFFYLTQAIKKSDLKTASFILENSEGKLWGSYFNWQSVAELKTLYAASGFGEVVFYPIGTFSEILIEPDTVSPEDRQTLFRIEEEFPDERTGCARYVLACARKR